MGFLIFTRHVPSSLALPNANSLPEDRAPIPSPLLPSPTALGAAFDTRNRLVVLGRQTVANIARRRTARTRPLSFSLSLRIRPRGLYLALRSSPPSFSRALSIFLLPVLFIPLPASSLLPYRHYSIHSVSRRGYGASQLHGARQLRNNNNAVRRCVASCGARHRNATPWFVRKCIRSRSWGKSLVDSGRG